MLPRGGIKTLEVLIRKGTQQPCGLLTPAGVRRRIERPHARMAGEVGLGFVSDRRRPVVHNQVQTPGAGMTSGELPERPQAMLLVIRLQTTAPHRAIIDVER